MNEHGYTLSIESAVLGGSCCIADGSGVVAESMGSGGVSRAEDLLLDINSLLRTSGITQREVARVVVSAGPGSFTGVRIGIATALGLSAGLGIVADQISLFDSMAIASNISVPNIVALPAGRGMAHLAIIDVSTDAINHLIKPTAVPLVELIDFANASSASDLTVFKGQFANDVLIGFRGKISIIDLIPASTLANASLDARIRKDVEPILISKTQSDG